MMPNGDINGASTLRPNIGSGRCAAPVADYTASSTFPTGLSARERSRISAGQPTLRQNDIR